MPGDFITLATRITTELRRSNLLTEAKAAVNDAILEASGTRFWFNEMRGVTFLTVIGQEYYPDLGLTEIDVMWWLNGSSRWNVDLDNNLNADRSAAGNVNTGPLSIYSRHDVSLRLYPIPSTIITVNLEGYGRLTPNPLVNDADANAWTTEGERYIRALAKSILLKDVVRDYSEAAVFEAIADDYKTELISQTALRIGTGELQGTLF